MVFPSKLKITVLRESGEKENFLLFMERYIQLCQRFDNLKNEIVARYPELVKYEEIKFSYVDEEGDEITILSHDDYYDYMKTCVVPTQPRRIFVRGVNKIQPMVVSASAPSEESPMEEDTAAPRQQESAPAPAAAATATVTVTEPQAPEVDQPVHTNIICDVCDQTIRGHRYKCLQCFNYDLCMRCEAKFRHKDHLMVRIPKPEMNQRGPFRLFEKLRSFAADIGVGQQQQQQCGTTTSTANDCREDEYENSKRSKRHHRRHSKDRSDSKERREEKERKERKHRRERSAKSAEERRSARRYGHGFNFSHLINQVIDPANIQSAFLSSDAAAAAAAAAAESAQEAAQQAVRATMANCPFFAATTATTTTATSSASTAQTASTSASASATTSAPEPAGASAAQTENLINMGASTSTSANDETATPPKQVDVLDFSWLAPTPESIQKINQTFSRILDPLGMNIEIRSNGNSPKPAQTQTPTEEKKDKTTETANTPTTSTPSQTTPTATASTAAPSTSSKATEMDPLVAELGKKLESALLADPELEKKLEKKLEAVLLGSDDEDDDDSTDSSVSLLSDNEEAAETSEKSEKKWTLIDIPNDNEEQTKKSTEDVEMAAEASTANEPVAVAVASGSSTKTPASLPEPESASSANNGRISQPLDYEQLGKALKQHLEAEKQQATVTPNNTSAPPTPAAPASKEATPAPKVVTPPPKVVTPPAPVVQPTPAANVMHSRRPHVNRAVEAMIVMGFSNEGGWLTQLLESVDGDIPRALDLLTPQRMNP